MDKEDRRLVLSALNAAGYRAIAVTNAKHHEAKKRGSATRRTPVSDDDGDEGNSRSLSPKDGVPSTVTVIIHPRSAARACLLTWLHRTNVLFQFLNTCA